MRIKYTNSIVLKQLYRTPPVGALTVILYSTTHTYLQTVRSTSRAQHNVFRVAIKAAGQTANAATFLPTVIKHKCEDRELLSESCGVPAYSCASDARATFHSDATDALYSSRFTNEVD